MDKSTTGFNYDSTRYHHFCLLGVQLPGSKFSSIVLRSREPDDAFHVDVGA